MKDQTGQGPQTVSHTNMPGIVSLLLALLMALTFSVGAAEELRGGEELRAEETRTFPLLEKELDPDNLKPTALHAKTNTGSSVNHLTRQYETDNPGLTVKVPGGYISVSTRFENGHWSVGPTRTGLDGQSAEWSGLSFHVLQAENQEEGKEEILTAIVKDGLYNYNLPGENMALKTQYDADGNLISETYEYVGEQVFLHEQFSIRPTAGGYQWQDKYGAWTSYDGDGRMLAEGDRRGSIQKALYDVNHTLLGYADRTDTQVIWIDYDTDGRIAAVRDSGNRRVEYTYYPSTGSGQDGRLWTVKDVLGHETSYEYNDAGQVTTVNKPGGRKSVVTYNDSGEVASVVNAEGNGYYFEYNYDKSKKEYYALARTTSGRIKEYWYDEEGDTIRIDFNGDTIQTIVKDGNALIITDERGLQTRQEFDEWDNLKKVIYPDGSMVSYSYDLRFNRRSREVDERGIITTYEYDDNGDLIKQTEAVGTDAERVTEYAYTPDGNPDMITMHLDDTTTAATQMTYYPGTDSLKSISDPELNVIELLAYDAMGNMTRMKDGRGKIWTYTYDNAGRMRTLTDPLSHTTERIYDVAGNLERTIDANNHATIYRYDLQDRLVEIEDSFGGLTTFEYNADGELLRQTDPEGKFARYEYDTYGRQTKIIDGNGNEIVMEYADIIGSGSSCSSCSSGGGANQPSRIIYPTFSKEFRYDQRGRKIEERDITNTDTLITSYIYDTAGNLLATTDKEQHTTHYAYDALSRLNTVTDPIGQTTYAYNALGNLTALTDAENQTTHFEYDDNGRLHKEIRPMSQETVYTYDGAGNLIDKLDAKLQHTAYTYDDAGRLEQMQYADGTTVTLTYDNAGNLKSYDDGTTSGAYAYDALNRKLSETVNYGSFSKSFSYDYYQNGLKKTFTMPDSTAYGYTYDANNQLTSVDIPGVGQITYPSYTWTRPDSVIYPGGTKREYTYDPFMRLERILASAPGGNALLDYQYTYDNMNNILSKQTQEGTYNYAYDALSRLTSVDVPDVDDEAFNYDRVGNRKTDGGGNEWTYNENNELLTAFPTLSDQNAIEYVYDANGNTTEMRAPESMGGHVLYSYVYNAADRLVKVCGLDVDATACQSTATPLAEYAYDPFGRRLWKDVSGTATYFFYADEGLVAEYDEIGAETTAYGYQPNSTWTTDPLFLKQDGAYYFYQNDHLGTPQKLVGVNGAMVWSAEYTAFGETEVQVEMLTNNLRLPGQYYDIESELFYNRNRYYNPILGRYSRSDPIGYWGGLNVYSYSNNRPIIGFDHMGLACYLRLHAIRPPDHDYGAPIVNLFAPDYQVGHSFVSLEDEEGNVFATSISHPHFNAKNPLHYFWWYPTHLNNENPSYGSEICTIEINCKQYEKAMHWIDKKHHYNLMSNNCTDFVFSVLAAAEVHFPIIEELYTDGPLTSPQELADLIQRDLARPQGICMRVPNPKLITKPPRPLP